MFPPQLQMHWHASESIAGPAGPVIATLVDPGVHGLEVAGMHGCGVSTPLAAAVAAAT
jgi:hypothetical protein